MVGQQPVVFGELAQGGRQFGVAVADVAALGELVADVGLGAVVAHEFGFSAGHLQVDGEVEHRAGVQIVEGVEELRAGEGDALPGCGGDRQDGLVAVGVVAVGAGHAQRFLPRGQPAPRAVVLVAVVEFRCGEAGFVDSARGGGSGSV